MTGIEYMILSVPFIFLFVLLNLSRANDKTFKQKMELLNKTKTREELIQFTSVTYDKHFLYVFFFMDPMKLYKKKSVT